MNHFCPNCGRPLTEGETCYCNMGNVTYQGNEVNSTLPQENRTVQNNTPNNSNNTVDISVYFKDILEVLKTIFVKPVEAIKNFVVDNKFISGIILIFIAAIISGLYSIALYKSVGFEIYKPNYAKAFFDAFFNDLIISASLIGVLYLGLVALLKTNVTIKKIINIVAISLVTMICADVLKSILVFSDANVMTFIRSYIGTFAEVCRYIILVYCLRDVVGLDKNKLFIALPSIIVSSYCIVDILDKIFK